jgi:cytochrome c biogenesis protein ResB
LKLAEKNVPVTIGDLTITYQSDTVFSGFQVSHDPANLLFWISSILFIIGITIVFYFPYRQAWVLTQTQKPGISRILARVGGSRGMGGEPELKKLVAEMEKELSSKPGKKSKEAA